MYFSCKPTIYRALEAFFGEKLPFLDEKCMLLYECRQTKSKRNKRRLLRKEKNGKVSEEMANN